MRNVSTKQINMQRNIILILVVVLIFALTTTTTLALYSRFVSDQTSITLSNPVNIYILNNNDYDDPLQLPEGKVIFPGSRINLTLGFILGKENEPSSNAYVRVKLKITSDALAETGGTIIEEGLVVYNTTPYSNENLNYHWIKADFSPQHNGSDVWWLYVSKTIIPPTETTPQQTTYSAKIAENGQQRTFLDGSITISTELTNVFANKKIDVVYSVSAIQSANVENPIKSGNYYLDSVTGERIYIATWGVAATI
jgi:hypothetical protein